jgi:hypothetical protein
MQKYLTLFEHRLLSLTKINQISIIFIVLFFAETDYYLLILQTGIVDFFHSNLTRIWTMPIGGILGIVSISLFKDKDTIIRFALLIQTILMFFYPNFNIYTLFLLGYLSGLVAPYLIFQVQSLLEVLIVLTIAYSVGTLFITILPEDRKDIAIVLSIISCIASIFVNSRKEEKSGKIAIKEYFYIFIWLLLDATLFETLSRSSIPIWGDFKFTNIIIVSHLLGIFTAYKFADYKYNNRVILTLFALSYIFFIFNFQDLLAIFYPIVISYYNVIILKRFMSLSFKRLRVATLSLWGSSGLGLFIALHKFF